MKTIEKIFLNDWFIEIHIFNGKQRDSMQQKDCQSQKILRDGLEKRKKNHQKSSAFSSIFHEPELKCISFT